MAGVLLRWFTLPPAQAWRWTLVAGYLTILGVSLPGHLSGDSVISLWEGRTGVRQVWGPPMYSAILGFFDRVLPGAALYVAASLLLLFMSWAGLRTLRPRTAWAGPVLLVVVLLLPGLVGYQATVWKDVLFANLTVAGFVCLAHAALRFDDRPRPWLPLAAALICFAFGTLVRQNGAIMPLFAGLALAWTARGEGWRRGAGWGLVGFLGPLILAVALGAVTPVREAPGQPKLDVGLRMVRHYDIAGAVAADPARPLAALTAENPTATAILRRDAPRVYSPQRSDALTRSQTFGILIWGFSDKAIADQWRQTVTADPVGYVVRRLGIYRWTFMAPDVEFCLPIHTGVMGPPAAEKALRMPTLVETRDTQVFNYATWFFPTPVYSHLSYALIALGVLGFTLWRRDPADVMVAALMASALSFAASFAVISLACDYRYLYALDLAALTGVLYLALDPGRRRGAPA